MASTPDYPADVRPDAAMSRILNSLRGTPSPAPVRTPFVETTLSGEPVVIGIHVPHEPHIPADARLVGYWVTRDGAVQHECPTPVDAARQLLVVGMALHIIQAIAQAGDVTWRCEWSPLARSWSQWRIA